MVNITDLLRFLPLVGIALVAIVAYRERALLKLWAERVSVWFTPDEQPPKHLMWSLFLASFATLYVEIMMIRWIGTEVRIFAYFQNLALISCFLGFGLGCYWSGRRKSLLFSVVAMAALVVLVQAPVGIWQSFLIHLSNQLSLSPDAAQWGGLVPLRGMTVALLSCASLVAVTVFLLLLVVVMVPLGQWVGYYLDRTRNPIRAYTVNLMGSVAGIWIFASLAFFWLPVGYWFALGFLVLVLARRPSVRFAVAGVALLGVSLLLLRYPQIPARQTYWSPYQKLVLTDRGDQHYRIGVNNTGYMTISRYQEGSSYDLPFRFTPNRGRVLIVSAGAGNDTAAALRNGAAHVDAVEIDPVIYFLGQRLHPEHPYDSPKVQIILNDARAFLRRAQGGYDVILFGLLDSHTQFSDYSNMRIDNYVYTEEALREARRLLNPNGVLIVKFEVRAPWTWMGQRFYAMLERVFDRPPIAFFAPSPAGPLLASATVFVTANDDGLWARAAQPELAALIARHPPHFPLSLNDAPPTVTDDWPYLYHRSRSIPRTYLTVSLILLAMALVLVGRVLEPGQISTWHFFLLGAGFLLLETQMISRLALYFGTTWVVNCVALTAILLILVMANFVVAQWRPRRLGPFYVLLVLSLVGNYFFPWQRLPYAAQTVGIWLSVAYLFPVFFAGIVFTESFRRCERKSSAFGANIVGAVAGGLAQNLSFIMGVKALLPLAALFYAAAGVSGFLEQRHVAERSASARAISA